MNNSTRNNKTQRPRMRFEPVTVRAAVRLLHEARQHGWHPQEVAGYIEALSTLEPGGQPGRGPWLHQLARRRAGLGGSAMPRTAALHRRRTVQPTRVAKRVPVV